MLGRDLLPLFHLMVEASHGREPDLLSKDDEELLALPPESCSLPQTIAAALAPLMTRSRAVDLRRVIGDPFLSPRADGGQAMCSTAPRDPSRETNTGVPSSLTAHASISAWARSDARACRSGVGTGPRWLCVACRVGSAQGAREPVRSAPVVGAFRGATAQEGLSASS